MNIGKSTKKKQDYKLINLSFNPFKHFANITIKKANYTPKKANITIKKANYTPKKANVIMKKASDFFLKCFFY